MPFVIRRTDQGGGFVADMRLSRGGSYTKALHCAKTWHTREAADAERCPENEVVEFRANAPMPQ